MAERFSFGRQCQLIFDKRPINSVHLRWLRTIVLLIFSILIGTDCSAQQSVVQATGQITGTVTDPGGAVVTGAFISLEDELTYKQSTATSDGNGFFKFTALPAGSFRITISSPGFADWIASETLRNIGQHEELHNIVLKIASVDVSVNVSPQAVTQQELAVEQVKMEEHQRILGIVPNYYAVYIDNAAAMSPKLKFSLAWKTTLDPFSVFSSGAIAGVQQWQNDFPGYGHGAQGYGKRFGASYATSFSDILLSGAVFPVVLHQDPRYFYKGTGGFISRALYAVSTTVICKGDSGRWQPNYSNVLGNLSSGAISNLYYPSSRRSVQLTMDNALINFVGGAIGDLAQEFFLKKITSNANHSH